MADIQRGEDILYKDLAQKLFDGSGEQRLIPFLGAGVSLSARSTAAPAERGVHYPSAAKIEDVLATLQLEGRPRKLVTFALAAAYMMAAQDYSVEDDGSDLMNQLAAGTYPPSVAELAQVFSELSNHGHLRGTAIGLREKWPREWEEAGTDHIIELLRLLVRATGLPSDSLTNICGYYETASGRATLWNNLVRIFQGKKTPTPTHEMIARAAKYYLDLGPGKVVTDYLIITANYDCLMEEALVKVGVPFAVLFMKKEDNKIHVRFSDTVGQLARHNVPSYPNHFHLSRREPLAVIYKIHGCLESGQEETDDSVVISDNDYVDYISRMATSEGVVPAYVGTLMRKKPFLFLGYSLNDWNVRSIFQMIVRKRADEFGVRDYSVMRRFTKFEATYCDRNRVTIIDTDLQFFVNEISALEVKIKPSVSSRAHSQ